MAKAVKFTAELMDAGGGGVYVLFPYSTEQLYGVKGRVPIRAIIDGESYQGSLIRYGTPQHMLLVLKSIRTKIGKDIGDMVDVTVWHDQDKRTVDVPKDFAKALKENKLKAAFDKMSYSHQREWMLRIENAKKEETRMKRMERAIEKLRGRA
ncbi:MAG: DUF1905 domain-containing protein [Bacteroidetes bacterium]|nr:DUF1905 domain-containing protein [Bacteroidota bacterium]